jgi:osmotically-inducible protein OsmY
MLEVGSMMRPTQRLLYTTLAAAVIAAATACATAPYKTSEQQVNDKETTEAVEAALKANTHIYTQHVTVQADNGVVHLGGYIWNDFDQYEAERTAESVPGVSKVVDEMELELNGIDNSPVSR